MFRPAPQFATGPGPAGCRRIDVEQTWRFMTGRHGHGHGAGHRRPGFGGPPFGWGAGGPPFPPFGPPGGFRRGRKARRGDIRMAALLLLAEQPRNGYQIMQELEQRSGGAWRPSAGSIYPALQLLEDEGLIRSEEEAGGRKLLTLTDAGRRVVEERGEHEPAPWDEMAGDVPDETWAIMGTMREIGFALFQLLHTGSDAQRAEARRLLAGLRRDLYQMLAEGGESGGEPPAAGGGEQTA